MTADTEKRILFSFELTAAVMWTFAVVSLQVCRPKEVVEYRTCWTVKMFDIRLLYWVWPSEPVPVVTCGALGGRIGLNVVEGRDVRSASFGVRRKNALILISLLRKLSDSSDIECFRQKNPDGKSSLPSADYFYSFIFYFSTLFKSLQFKF